MMSKYIEEDIKRLAKALNKAKQGEKELVIGFLGGSITQGCTPSIPENAYAMRVYKWIKNKFRDISIKYINAGIGATGSLIGVHRVEQDLLCYQPDIIFVEFAANDVPPNRLTAEAYESLIRRIINTCPEVAIVEICMTLEDGTSAEIQQKQIAQHYNIPVVSFRQEVFNQIKKGTYTWKDIAVDEVHPNDKGHEIVAGLITELLECACDYKGACEDRRRENPVGETLFSDKYVKGTILNSYSLEPIEMKGFIPSEEGFKTLNKGWKLINNHEASFTCEITAKNIFLLYVKGIEVDRAKVEIAINNKSIELDSFFENGWGSYAEVCALTNGNIEQKHSVCIRIVDTNPNACFNILGFLVS